MTTLVLLAVSVVAGTASGSVPVRIAVKSGTPQSARAWAASGANVYETAFDQALVVTVSPADTRVRFRCVTPGCIFPPSDQPDGVDRVDTSAFDVASDKGIASIKLVVRSVSTGSVTVVATPATDPHGPAARFILNAR